MHPPRIIAAEHRKHEPRVTADILKSTKDMDGN